MPSLADGLLLLNFSDQASQFRSFRRGRANVITNWLQRRPLNFIIGNLIGHSAILGDSSNGPFGGGHQVIGFVHWEVFLIIVLIRPSERTGVRRAGTSFVSRGRI
jgi:hypothetical protein